MRSIAVLPGDGVGPEVVAVVMPIIEKMGLPVSFRYGEVGWKSWCATGNAMPPATWQLLEETDTCLLGAVTSKPVREAEAELIEPLRGTGVKFVSPVVQLRQRLELFANVRPVMDLAADRFDFVIIRENTEGLYAGLDFHGMNENLWSVVKDHPNAEASGPEDTSATIRLQTRYGIDRLLRFGFEYARKHGYRLVTVADKPNVLRNSSNYLRGRLELIAAKYPEINAEILNVDATALWMVRRPERFGVIIAENMFGDILSDVGAGVMGGLGLAPSGNIGDKSSYFEPVHGSAPAMAGLAKANPMALFLTVAQMLQHLDLPAPAEQINSAVRAVVRTRSTVTYDLGGGASTPEAASAVQVALVGAQPRRQASVIAVGDELLSGAVLDTNTARISGLLGKVGYQVRAHLTAGDTHADIKACVGARLGIDDVMVVVGGLGPTSDDITRDGVAAACGLASQFSETAWDAVRSRLLSFNLPVHDDNRRQAYFPVGSELLPNDNGTAWGAQVVVGRTTVLMVPGPPNECLPMVSAAIASLPQGRPVRVTRWRLLGVLEADIAAEVDAMLRSLSPDACVSYIWKYPYVDVTVTQSPAAPPLPEELDRLLDPHTVSRQGRSAFAELGAAMPFGMATATANFAETELLAGVRRTGIEVGMLSGPRLASLSGRAEGSSEGTGTLHLSCVVDVDGSAHHFGLAIPNRGPEVAEYAAEFYAWSLNRALAANP